MYYIYMDETWDLWFNESIGNSDYFFIVMIITKDSKITEDVIKKIFKRMKKNKVNNKTWFFHAYKERHDTVITLLNYITNKDIMIMTSILDKKKSKGKVWKDIHLLYNTITCKLLQQIIQQCHLEGEYIKFYASRRETNKHLNKCFSEQIKDSCIWIVNIDVILKYPKEEKWLQVVDGVAFALYHKYEKQDLELYNIIKPLIIIEEKFCWYKTY